MLMYRLLSFPFYYENSYFPSNVGNHHKGELLINGEIVQAGFVGLVLDIFSLFFDEQTFIILDTS